LILRLKSFVNRKGKPGWADSIDWITQRAPSIRN
jgi:hypothetical protein